jgi:hypothetical protein
MSGLLQVLMMGSGRLDTRSGFSLGRCSFANASAERRAQDLRRQSRRRRTRRNG